MNWLRNLIHTLTLLLLHKSSKKISVLKHLEEKQILNQLIATRTLVMAHFLRNCNSVNKETKRMQGFSVY